MNELSADRQADVLGHLVERGSVRGTARTVRGNSPHRERGMSVNTVLKLVADAGDAAQGLHKVLMSDAPATRVEADEAYCIVGMNPKTAFKKRIELRGVGAVWLWVALEAETKLVLSWHIGTRSAPDAEVFMSGLSALLNGQRVQLTTDSLKAYPDIVHDAFGGQIDYATVKKRSAEEEEARQKAEAGGKRYRVSRKRAADGTTFAPSDPVVQIGSPNLSLATTNHIEAFWAQVRKDLSRMTRRTSLISKNVENLNRAFALYVFYHNFIKPHRSLKGLTPGQAAGLQPKWDWTDFVEYVSELRSERRALKLKLKSQPPPPEPIEKKPVGTLDPRAGLPFCVFHNTLRRTAKVHQSHCVHLRTAPGRSGLKGQGRKLYCESLAAAEAVAAEMAPGSVTECKMCLGTPSRRDAFGPR